MTTTQQVRVDCPAKINLTLHVGARRDDWDGRHELGTIYCAIGVTDTITVSTIRSGSGFSLDLSGSYLGDLAASSTDMRNNHAVRALFAMARASGHDPDVAIHIEKRIPVGAGLAGGSADAAGTMLALNELWDLHWSYEQLQPIAATLGADMPFCLAGGYAHGTGFGEHIEILDNDDPRIVALRADGYSGHVLVGAYRAQLSTPEVYRTFDAIGTDHASLNDLQAAAISLHPRSGQAISDALQAGATQAFVSGSGPSVIAFAPDESAVASISQRWKQTQSVDRQFITYVPAYPRIMCEWANVNKQ